MANIKDFAVGLVVTAPSPATTGTTLTLRTGEGPTMPATPFFATASPPGQLTTTGTSEKISVTGVSGDTLTFVRAQGSTTAQSIAAGWVIANAIYAADVAAVGNNTITTKEVPTGSINGTNTTFTCSQSYVGSSLQVYVNGIAQSGYITETTPASGIFNLDVAPLTGDTVVASYQHVASVTGNSDTVDGFHAASSPTANTIPVLGSDGNLPIGVLPSAYNYQTDNANSIANVVNAPVRMQMGWSQVVGNNTALVSDTVSFPVPFTTLLGITVSLLPVHGSIAANITQLDLNYTTTASIMVFGPITASGCQVSLTRTSATFSTAAYYGYSWIAWGI